MRPTTRNWRGVGTTTSSGSETYAIADGDIIDYNEGDVWLEDLVCMNDDSSEVQMVFPQELPMVMDEAEAVDKKRLQSHGGDLLSVQRAFLLVRARAKERKARAKALQRLLEKLLHTPVLGAKVVIWNIDGNFKLWELAVDMIVHGFNDMDATTPWLTSRQTRAATTVSRLVQWDQRWPTATIPKVIQRQLPMAAYRLVSF